MSEAAIPALARGFRLRRDDVRDQWVVLGPERAFVPDAIAVEILRRLNGTASAQAIIDDLATTYAAPRAQIATDVLALLHDLRQRGVVRDVVPTPAAPGNIPS